ncbi:hypothetical protein [Acinetobacter phage P1068]|nr:hypothetical protein [Acinetobacter phage P1068]
MATMSAPLSISQFSKSRSCRVSRFNFGLFCFLAMIYP